MHSKNHASTYGGEVQVELAFIVVFSPLGTLYLYKNWHQFYTFPTRFGLEVVLPIECEIPSLKLAVKIFPDTSTKEEWLLYLSRLDKNCH